VKISIVTWDCNFREKLHTIDFFCNQTISSDEYEFIWVDFYNSSDAVRKKISDYPQAKLIELGNPPSQLWNLGRCINAGVSESSGEILVLPDGDIAVESDFLSTVLKKHDGEKRPHVIYYRRWDEPRDEHVAGCDIDHLKKVCKLFNPLNYAGCYSVARSGFDLVGGYDEHEAYSGPGMSGREIYMRYRNAGLPIEWTDVKVFHPWHEGTGKANDEKIKKQLKVASSDYSWIDYTAGLKQSWLYSCREKNVDVLADFSKTEEYLAKMPAVDLDSYTEAESSFERRLAYKNEIIDQFLSTIRKQEKTIREIFSIPGVKFLYEMRKKLKRDDGRK